LTIQVMFPATRPSEDRMMPLYTASRIPPCGFSVPGLSFHCMGWAMVNVLVVAPLAEAGPAMRPTSDKTATRLRMESLLMPCPPCFRASEPTPRRTGVEAGSRILGPSRLKVVGSERPGSGGLLVLTAA